MNRAEVVLFPTTRDRVRPTFHVRPDLRTTFVAHLEHRGFKINELREAVREDAHGRIPVAEVYLEPGTRVDRLAEAKDAFLARIHAW